MVDGSIISLSSNLYVSLLINFSRGGEKQHRGGLEGPADPVLIRRCTRVQ